jgi:hypothetical protein
MRWPLRARRLFQPGLINSFPPMSMVRKYFFHELLQSFLVTFPVWIVDGLTSSPHSAIC